MNEQEQSLRKAIEQATVEYERIISGSAVRTRQMLERYGDIRALSRLMESGEIQTGFRQLMQANKSELTFEAIIVRHKSLFRLEVVEGAKFRLDNHHQLS